MSTSEIIYKIKSANENEIYLHLIKCSDNFLPLLSEKINIREYSKKLFQKSVTFEAWDHKDLIGCVASYFNEAELSGFITNVSIIKEFMGRGIASILINQCVEYAKGIKINEVLLEVNVASTDAIHLYKKIGFTDLNKNENNIIMKLKLMNNL